MTMKIMMNNNDKREGDAILSAYNDIKIKIPELEVDSLRVVKSVVKHRNFWKPRIVKTMLLAESHVFTSDNDNSNFMRYPNNEAFSNLPKEYVKLVYCLGYGEKDLVPNVRDNPGTWQYWKLFSACAADSYIEFQSEFNKVSKGGCQNLFERLKNKVDLLIKLKEKGIWLVDSCIVSLYGLESKPEPEYRSEAIIISWRNYISKLIEEVIPNHIIIIGKGVSSVLKEEIKSLGIEYTNVPQPQKRMTSDEIEEVHKIHNSICNR